jgi:predicted adenylyl cyclase CyaB
MRELEGKFLVSTEESSSVLDDLASHGLDFSPALAQVDYVYATSPDIVLNPDKGSVVARVRVEEDGRVSLTVKIRRESELDRTELEIVVSDSKTARSILVALGMREIVEVKKTRRSIKLGASTVITLDEVDELGTFVEIEVLGDEAKSASIKLEDVMSTVRVALGGNIVRVHKGYDRLLLERQSAE